MERVPTGIYGLDSLIEGGFPKGRQILVSGTSGTGKTIFGIQYLVKGAIDYGEPGVYITFEQTPNTLKEDMKRFNWDLEQLERNGDLIIIDASGPVFGFKSEEDFTITKSEFSLKGVLENILKAVEEIDAKRLVIDSITALGARYDSEWKIRNVLLLLNIFLTKLNVTSILICESEKPSKWGVEEFLCDGVIWLRVENIGRTLLIKKMRGTNHSQKIHPYKIEGGKGFVILEDSF
jgi:KaiC/GvpD/RAD55 family RecA-like ATPase